MMAKQGRRLRLTVAIPAVRADKLPTVKDPQPAHTTHVRLWRADGFSEDSWNGKASSIVKIQDQKCCPSNATHLKLERFPVKDVEVGAGGRKVAGLGGDLETVRNVGDVVDLDAAGEKEVRRKS
jgi:hypothetical protein